MKKFLSVILAVVLLGTVGGSLVNGTMASFFDTEVSTENYLCAGTRVLELSGGPIVVTCGVPCKWYEEEYTLLNTGTLTGVVILHIPATDDEYPDAEGIKCLEAGTVNGEVWNGSDYVLGSPVGGGVATSEPELGAEEGNFYIGQLLIDPIEALGVDAGADRGIPDDPWVMSKHIEIRIWYDKDGDGNFDPDDLIDLGEPPVKLADIVCQQIELGEIPPGGVFEAKGGGWGSYFKYHINDTGEILELPLIVGQDTTAGTVTVQNDGANIYVDYDTTSSGWEMATTHVYVGTDPPEKMSPGKFPYKHDPVSDPYEDSYIIPFSDFDPDLEPCTEVYIATHAEGTDGETGWARGEYRKFKIELHLQQLEAPEWADWPNSGGVDYDQDGDIDDDDAQKRWWPTNALQGDQCIFDMVFYFQRDSPKRWK